MTREGCHAEHCGDHRGPNVSGIASGTKATSAPAAAGAFAMEPVAAEDGWNSEKPIRIRMMPPTIRTMLSGTSKIFSSKVPRS
jgi:hypothetical protein